MKTVLELDGDQEGTEEVDLLAFLLDTTIQDWGESLESQQMIVAEDRSLTTEQALTVSANLFENLQILKQIRGKLNG